MNTPPQENTLSSKPRRRAPRRAGNYYANIAGIALIGIVGALIVAAFVIKVVHPYQLGWAVNKDIQRVQNELSKQEAQNQLLEKRLAYLKTPDGAETEARRSGFARPGELVYLLRSDKK